MILVGIYISTAILGNRTEISQKIKNRTIIWTNNPIPKKWNQYAGESSAMSWLL
jgi:hypothetical protein